MNICIVLYNTKKLFDIPESVTSILQSVTLNYTEISLKALDKPNINYNILDTEDLNDIFNLDIEYDLNKNYINDLFLLVKKVLKPIYPRYMCKKKNIVKQINKIGIKGDLSQDLEKEIQSLREWFPHYEEDIESLTEVF